jgi:hypothetical protein
MVVVATIESPSWAEDSVGEAAGSALLHAVSVMATNSSKAELRPIEIAMLKI